MPQGWTWRAGLCDGRHEGWHQAVGWHQHQPAQQHTNQRQQRRCECTARTTTHGPQSSTQPSVAAWTTTVPWAKMAMVGSAVRKHTNSCQILPSYTLAQSIGSCQGHNTTSLSENREHIGIPRFLSKVIVSQVSYVILVVPCGTLPQVKCLLHSIDVLPLLQRPGPLIDSCRQSSSYVVYRYNTKYRPCNYYVYIFFLIYV